jgi:hypothetical protein
MLRRRQRGFDRLLAPGHHAIPTDEELMIARHTLAVLREGQASGKTD